MQANARSMVVGSFIADSLALGVHWIYNVNVIDKKIGRLEHLITPDIATYHQGKEAGEFTHYGDQTLVLLESLADSGGFNLHQFAFRWQRYFQDYDGYFDQATKATLNNLESQVKVEQAGSESIDLAGASRIAPLVYFYRNDINKLVEASKAQTMMTHRPSQISEAAAYFAKVTANVLDGTSPVEALKNALQEIDFDESLEGWVEAGFNSQDQETRAAIKDFGQMCEIDAAFPATIHLIVKYEQDFKLALVENSMAGGDSAARGMLVGMVLGAYLGFGAIPKDWLNELKAYQHLIELMDAIDIGADG